MLDQLAVALGFATLAGINLYLTSFVTGLAIHFNWVVLAERYEELSVLGEWPVLCVTGALLLTEGLADKIPWVDSVWDAFHSLVRPVGGGLLAISTLGATQPEFDVIIALVAGSTTLVSHGFKAGTRLAVNHSPEPFSNGAVSLAEDAAVFGGLALMAVNPRILAVACFLFLLFAIVSFPRIFRRLKGFYWLLFQNFFGIKRMESTAGHTLPAVYAQAISEATPGGQINWEVPVLVSRGGELPGVRPWLMGHLVGVTVGGREQMQLVMRKYWRTVSVTLPEVPMELTHEEGMLSEKLHLYDPNGGFRISFRIPKSDGSMLAPLRERFPVRELSAGALPAPV
ncbi:MAG: DUF4126 domain-containing protein [Verrucomicrobiota bacterium]